MKLEFQRSGSMAWLWIVILFAGCAAPLQQAGRLGDGATLDTAIDHAADNLLTQLQRLPEFQSVLQRTLQSFTKVRIMVDTAVDTSTGQATAATQFMDSRLLGRATAKFPQFDVQPKSPESLASARYILVPTLTLLTNADRRSGNFRVNLSLTDQRTGLVVAQAAATSVSTGVDSTPTAFFRDSPALARDPAVEGQIRTSQSAVGTEADGVYLSGLSVSLLIDEGSRLYGEGKYIEALRVYEEAVSRPDGKQARVFNGLYLTNNQLGRTSAAQEAFSNIVRLGLLTNNLSVRFLFQPGSTEFINDRKISGIYPVWLDILSTEIEQGGYCLIVVGHSSRTGTEEFNDRLSLQRAQVIRERLQANRPEISLRLRAAGMGFRENLIGTGTDDLRDALDRRVEFKVGGCD